MIIKKVLLNKNNKTKYVVVPRDSDIQPGEYVEIVKVQDKSKDVKNDRDTRVQSTSIPE